MKPLKKYPTDALRHTRFSPIISLPKAGWPLVPACAQVPARELDQESACSGKHSSCRAVGQALRRNPFAPKVPCHRVIASDLSAGGFKGGLTDALIRRKLNLLGKEGVKFINGRLANPALIYRFNPPQAD